MKPESVVKLHDLHSLVSKDQNLAPSDEDLAKSTFKEMLEGGDAYSITDLETWFLENSENPKREVLDRILNIAHYQKTKFDARNKFRIVSGGSECSCGGNH